MCLYLVNLHSFSSKGCTGRWVSGFNQWHLGEMIAEAGKVSVTEVVGPRDGFLAHVALLQCKRSSSLKSGKGVLL